MGGVRNGKEAGSPETADARQRSPAGTPPSGEGADVPDLVERHRQSASRLLNEGQAARAFGELVRASRSLPMTPRLAAVLVTFSLRAGTEAAAIALLTSALGHTRGDTRRAVRLQLARVLRRVNQLPRSIEALQALVDESPGDRHARRLLDVIFRRIGHETTPPDSSASLDAPRSPEQLHRSETVEFSAPWGEDEHTVEASGPPDARFAPRAPQPRAEAPAEPSPEPARTVLEMPAAGSRDEVTSGASDLPFGVALAPSAPPRDDSAGAAFSHRRLTLELPTVGSPEDAPPKAPVSRPEAPLIPPPTGHKADAPVPWSGDEDTEPSRQLVPRQDDPEEARQEAQLIARRAWRELAQFYLARADRAKDLVVRTDILTRLAELLEDELRDPAGAARVYGQIVTLTGDKAALAEQVRLVSQRGDGDEWVVLRVLDEAVQRARNPRARAAAVLARGERLLFTGEVVRARADFEAAAAINPGSLPALMGLARCAPEADRARATERLRVALAAVPRRSPFRMEGLRCLAEISGGPLVNAKLAYWAWTEVLAENPEDVHAQDKLLELARQLGDRPGLSRLLRARIDREPRGLAARKARLELVATLEALGDREAALAELRQAVRFEPGHKEAWLLLVDRLIALKQHGEAAWALEHAATATEDDEERLGSWERLARFCRETLGDAARAQVYANRAENLRKAIAERMAPTLHPEPPRSAAPSREPSGPRTIVLIPPPGAVELTPTPAALARTVLELPVVGEAPAVEPPAAPVPVESTRVIAWTAPSGKTDTVRRRARGGPGPAEPPAPVVPPAPVSSVKPVPTVAPVETRPAAIERVREHPLEVPAYRELSAFFLGRGDTARGSLMAEVALALEGGKDAVLRPPRRALTPEERAGLRHPGLRNPAGELLASVGFALCRLFPTFGRAAGSTEPLRSETGPGARAAQEALLFVSGILDVQLPEVFLSEDEGPPFTLVHPGAPRLLVGRSAVRQVLPEPELRFFAGRALSCLGPDLLALRCLRKDQMLRAVAILASVLRGGSELGPESRVVRDALHPSARTRALLLLESAQREFDASALAEAARHSANRAGLVACGGPGPAVAALRALKSSEQELVELVRFAASERYLPLRG